MCDNVIFDYLGLSECYLMLSRLSQVIVGFLVALSQVISGYLAVISGYLALSGVIVGYLGLSYVICNLVCCVSFFGVPPCTRYSMFRFCL